MDKYQLTRTIRFKLKRFNGALQTEVDIAKKSTSDQELEKLLEELSMNMNSYNQRWSDFLYKLHEGKKNRRILNRIQVTPKWLELYARPFLYHKTSRPKHGKPLLTDYHGLPDYIENRLEEWQHLRETLDKLRTRPEHHQARRSEYALLIEKINIPQNFPFFYALADYAQDKDNEKYKNELIVIGERIYSLLSSLRKAYAPAQHTGIEIARASLNYFTINKKPKEYDDEIEQWLEEQNQEYTLADIKSKLSLNPIIIKPDIRDSLPDKATLGEWYSHLKTFKAEQRSALDNCMITSKSIEEWPILFKKINTNKAKELISLTSKITSNANKINNLYQILNDKKKSKRAKDVADKELKTIRNNQIQIKRKRGSIISKAPDFKNFVDAYATIAKENGKIKAKIRGLKKERQDSQLLNYWALLLENCKRHELLLIPRKNRKKVYKILEKLPKTNDKGEASVIYFKSLTLRALHKQIFSEDSTLKQNVVQQLKHDFPEMEGAYSMKDWEESKVVSLYQKVLKYCNDGTLSIDVGDFNIEELVSSSYSTIDKFRIALEKQCYIKRCLIDKSLYQELREREEFHLLSIESKDLNSSKPIQAMNEHTQLWKQFWSADNSKEFFPIRLNPEIKIRFREPKDTRIAKYRKKSGKYEKESGNYNPKKKNRYLHDQLTLEVTISENATGLRQELAFTKPHGLKEALDEYNQSFNKSYYPRNKLDDICFFGIDRGHTELATLLIIKKPNDNQASFQKFTTYRLIDLSHSRNYTTPERVEKTKYAKNNISDFIPDIENEDIFEKRETASLDLTTAKLIKGYIIENGDVNSYLNLKMLSAKRRIWEKHSISKIPEDISISLDQETGYFRFDTEIEEFKNPRKLYYFREELSDYLSEEDIKKELNSYLNKLRTKNQERDLLTLEKINHLRDAISSNITGILAYLLRKKEFIPGILVLEDLNTRLLESHFKDKSNEILGRRLEWKIYNKLSKMNLAPPQIKESTLLREDKKYKVKQFGSVLFVDETGTSNECPNCNKKPTDNFKEKSEKDEQKRLFELNKFQYKKYHCYHCGYDTKTNQMEFTDINNPDDLACFNIAKRGYEYILNPPKPKKTILKKTYSPKGKKQQGRKQAKNPPRTRKKPNKAATHNPFANLKDMMKKDN